jgi:hypothetical protein
MQFPAQVVNSFGAAQENFRFILSFLQYIHVGTGTPEAKVTAPRGHIYLRRDGGAATTLYVKESGTGNTGWVGK